MRRQIGLLAAAGLLGGYAAANAQMAPSPASATAFDGTYRFVSSATVNPTYTSRKGQMAPCPSRRPGPLHVVGGKAHYTTATGYRLAGMVGPQGELAMRVEATAPNGGSRPIEMNLNGNIDAVGTVHARQIGYGCSYDYVWHRAAR